mmetsp:Transcript_14416/g.31572  ORF Transcript_14416/g.31572 Transcript_14416/m.31572 type:complete len:140 (+) Transcript_14416:1499-1918(+)
MMAPIFSPPPELVGRLVPSLLASGVGVAEASVAEGMVSSAPRPGEDIAAVAVRMVSETEEAAPDALDCGEAAPDARDCGDSGVTVEAAAAAAEAKAGDEGEGGATSELEASDTSPRVVLNLAAGSAPVSAAGGSTGAST